MQKPLRVCLAIVNLPPVIIKGHVKNSLFLLRKWKKDMPTFTTSYQAQRWIFCSYFNWTALLQLRLPFCSTNAKRSELMQYHFICLQYLHWSFPDPTIASKCEKKLLKKRSHTVPQQSVTNAFNFTYESNCSLLHICRCSHAHRLTFTRKYVWATIFISAYEVTYY